ncbi:nucleoside/nucleotide kinase family protein [Microbacterium sp. NPDC091313]
MGAPRIRRPDAAAVAALADRIRREAIVGRRFVLGIAGCPGSGKTTLGGALVAALGQRAVALPMDGFHLANRTLDALGRRDRKGAPDTFDADGFVALLDRVRTQPDRAVFAPSFRREVDEPIAAEIAIGARHDIVIAEGNYLLLGDAPWSAVLPLLDAAWFCDAPDEVRRTRLVDRHMRHGRSREAAVAWARDVDERNASLIRPSSAHADVIVSGETAAVLEDRG